MTRQIQSDRLDSNKAIPVSLRIARGEKVLTALTAKACTQAAICDRGQRTWYSCVGPN